MESVQSLLGTIGIFVEIIVTTRGMLWIIFRYDDKHGITINKRMAGTLICISLLYSVWIGMGLSRWNNQGKLACGLLAAYLLVSSITDIQTCKVHDFLHFIGAVAGLWALWAAQPDMGRIVPWFLFWVMQKLLFMRMYGKADGMAFLVCALFESCYGEGMITYLLHMGAAYLVLAVVQMLCRNINKKGNLKQPVAFLPYIAGTAWFFL